MSTRTLTHFIAGMLLSVPVFAQSPAPASVPEQVTFYGNPNSNISSGVVIPANRGVIWTSGTTPSPANPQAPAASRERFGDTKTQAASILKTLAQQLERQGLTMKDVVYGWNAAYNDVFNTAANPTKTARSTVGVSALVNADWLIEIEAFAVFPQGK